MGVTQKYFDFTCCICCGLPSVTLLGEKADWELIYQRLAKIDTFGEEPTQFSKLLRPVISHFVKSFDEPASTDIVSFWQRIAHYHTQGSGPSFYSGWITAFCFWDANGKSMYRVPTDPESFAREKARFPLLELDGVSYHRIESDEVPPGYSSVYVLCGSLPFPLEPLFESCDPSRGQRLGMMFSNHNPHTLSSVWMKIYADSELCTGP